MWILLDVSKVPSFLKRQSMPFLLCVCVCVCVCVCLIRSWVEDGGGHMIYTAVDVVENMTIIDIKYTEHDFVDFIDKIHRT